jgi:hypothetical protein
MKPTTTQLRTTIDQIVELNIALRKFYPLQRALPLAGGPASKSDLAALKSRALKQKMRVAPSYLAALTVCDGVVEFDYLLNLLPAHQVLRAPDETLTIDYPALSRFVIAAGGTSAFVSLDLESQDNSGEMEVVWVMEDGAEFRYPNFEQFLTKFRDQLRKTHDTEVATRKQLPAKTAKKKSRS